MGETPAIKKFQEIPGKKTGNQGVGSRTDVGFPGFGKAVVCPAELLKHNGAQEQTPDEDGRTKIQTLGWPCTRSGSAGSHCFSWLSFYYGNVQDNIKV